MQEQLFTSILTGGTAGVIATLMTAIIMILKGWIVPGYIYQEAKARLTRYDEAAFKLMTFADRLKDGAG